MGYGRIYSIYIWGMLAEHDIFYIYIWVYGHLIIVIGDSKHTGLPRMKMRDHRQKLWKIIQLLTVFTCKR